MKIQEPLAGRKVNATVVKKLSHRKLSDYLKNWKKRDYPGMFRNSTLTFQHKHDSKFLEERFPFKFRNYEIKKVKIISDSMCHYQVHVKEEGKVHVLAFVLVCEVTHHLPSCGGEWGVNPLSIKRIL
jgi:hypothetical protein